MKNNNNNNNNNNNRNHYLNMIQWVFVFSLLVSEMVLLTLLILPLPAAVKRAVMKLTSTIGGNETAKRVYIGCVIIVFVLFVDALRVRVCLRL